jgi:serine/threonine protein kinase
VTPDRWRAINEIVHAALSRDATARQAFVAEACGDDPSLRVDVEALLAACDQTASVDGAVIPAPVIELAPGTRLGPYRIEALIGAGGMGEVYRASDTRLDRLVAIKILPPHLRSLAHLQFRFDREARAISQLTHPNICTLHDVGREGDIDFLVLEYLEGETLASRLSRGRIPLDQALHVAIGIATALDHAHRHDIVHRDLKPANVMLTKPGAKLLDFGIAKLRVPLSGSSTPAVDTATGTVVGTISYMAPEQLDGRGVDTRADIWAFGCVVYEMFSGHRPFQGETTAALIASIREDQPEPLRGLKPTTPPALDHVIRGCLAKNREERWQSAADIKRELLWIVGTEGSADTVNERSRRTGRLKLLTVALLLVLGGLGSIPGLLRSPSAKDAARAVTRFQLVPPKGIFVENAQISPDGRWIAFIGRDSGSPHESRRLWLQALDAAEASLLPDTEGAVDPAWAPDSRQLVFRSGAMLRRVDVPGGVPETLFTSGPEPFLCSPGGNAWGRGGVLLFHGGMPGILQSACTVYAVRVSERVPAPVTKLNESRRELFHLWPQFLPDGRHFLYVVHSAEMKWSGLYVGSVDSPESKRVLDVETPGLYVPSGHLLFSRDGAILAQPFDLTRLQLSGEPTPLAHDADYEQRIAPPQFSTALRPILRLDTDFSTSLFGTAIYSASQTGILTYSLFEPYQYQFVWMDRHGTSVGEVGGARPFHGFDLSRDAKRLVVSRANVDRLNLWTIDLSRNVESQLTFGPVLELDPRWGPDGHRVAATAWDENGNVQIIEHDSNRSISVIRKNAYLDDWSRDGRFLLFRPTAQDQLQALPRNHGGEPIVVHRAPGGAPQDVDQPRFSPDGHWIAYNAPESGKEQVYVVRFPPTGERWQVSVDGGAQPMWRRDGRELYYLALDGTIFAVEIRTGASLEAGVPRPLFRAPVGAVNLAVEQYATVDGERFLVLKQVERPSRPINVVVNWPSLLKK